MDQFLGIVADVVGELDAHCYGALLMSSAHGIAGLEASGHLTKRDVDPDGEQLVHLLVKAIESVIRNRESDNRTG